MRATIYNFFRVPLNAIVVALNLLSFSTAFTFFGCTVLLFLALCAAIVVKLRMHQGTQATGLANQLV